MRESDGSIVFKEWLPDLPPLNNPGLLEAFGCQPIEGAYEDFNSLTALAISGVTIDALPGKPIGTIYASAGGVPTIYGAAAISTGAAIIYGRSTFGFVGDSGAWTASSATLSSENVSFAQFDNFVIATLGDTGGVPTLYITIGSTTGFITLGSTSGTAPSARAIGVVNRFVVLGTRSSAGLPVLQWSGINNPTSWPTANSATAIAQQAGAQTMNTQYGALTGIASGDQFGIVLQQNAVTRMTYIGGSVVFQFDLVDKLNGCLYQNSVVQAGGKVYFAGGSGFFVTDGVSVRDISTNRIGEFFKTQISGSEGFNSVYGAIDERKNLIYWSVKQTNVAANPENRMMIYNYVEDRWTTAEQSHYNLFSACNYEGTSFDIRPLAYGASFTIGTLTGAAVTATFTTGEIEPNPGGFARVQGVKPMTDATLNAVTVAISSRNDLYGPLDTTADTTATARTGFADFRREGRYHRVRLTITGTFEATTGIEYQVEPSGSV